MILIFGILIIFVRFFFRRKKLHLKGKKIIIFGGTKGLGLALAHLLKKMGAYVTITSRTSNDLLYLKNKYGFSIYKIDVTNIGSFKFLTHDFDYIFVCCGICIPGYFADQNISVYRKTMEVNYFGTLNVLKYFQNYQTSPFHFIIISSSLSLWSCPGYASYSPTKAALKSFFDTVHWELEKSNIKLYIYFVSTINSPGLENENITKPSFTKFIDRFSYGENNKPEKRAKKLLEDMAYDRRIVSDFGTNLLKIRPDVTSIQDILLLPISMLIYPFWAIYVKCIFYKFEN
ncbi:3-ketodihydrosphingosine reductase [Astathelohania contejeani]|uniref:3-ketodihydrosphingosine reductase n=1 Tax=Astathelohania contejeani TaxID=164912 RepID=A0ABQ7HXE4_9MICR|nr:3-ketodihydrosphingosine reductase [Thelohania contejeani]